MRTPRQVRHVRRRRTLQLLGAGLFGGLAGCTGDDAEPTATERSTDAPDTPTPEPSPAPFEHHGTLETTFATNGEYPEDPDPADGYPPAFSDPPAAPDVDPSSFETTDVYGETVRLAPIDVVIDWYRRGEARFVDARGLEQYETAHVYGAVFSGAQREASGGGIDPWEPGDRVVTYCACPHHLSSIRAAGLQKAGFEAVYALDEGFAGRENAWASLEYPMAGTHWLDESSTQQTDVTLTGVTDVAYAGHYAWAVVEGQTEAAPIESNGEFSIHLSFAGVTADSHGTVRTPGYTVEGPLGELAEQRILPP